MYIYIYVLIALVVFLGVVRGRRQYLHLGECATLAGINHCITDASDGDALHNLHNGQHRWRAGQLVFSSTKRPAYSRFICLSAAF